MALEGVVTITKFVDRATVWILVLVYDVTGALTDPTSIEISIYDPDGTKQLLDDPNYEASMTQYSGETGIYEYYYHKGVDTDAMAAGKWRIEGDVIDGSGATAVITPFNSSFEVE